VAIRLRTGVKWNLVWKNQQGVGPGGTGGLILDIVEGLGVPYYLGRMRVDDIGLGQAKVREA